MSCNLPLTVLATNSRARAITCHQGVTAVRLIRPPDALLRDLGLHGSGGHASDAVGL